VDILHPDLLLERLVNHIRAHPACMPDDDRLLVQADDYLLMRDFPLPLNFYRWRCNCGARVDVFSPLPIPPDVEVTCPACGALPAIDEDEIGEEDSLLFLGRSWHENLA